MFDSERRKTLLRCRQGSAFNTSLLEDSFFGRAGSPRAVAMQKNSAEAGSARSLSLSFNLLFDCSDGVGGLPSESLVDACWSSGAGA